MWFLYICMLIVETGCMKAKAFVHPTKEKCYEQVKRFEEQDNIPSICFYKETS